MDTRRVKDALDLLEEIYEFGFDKLGKEKDTEMLVNSLLGLIKSKVYKNRDYDEYTRGLEHLEKAQNIGKEIGGTMYEKRKWLIIPSVNLHTENVQNS